MTDPNALFRDAELAFRKGNFPEAQSLLERVERMVPAQPAILHLRALVERRQGAWQAAESYFRKALRYSPGDGQIWNNFGNLLMDAHRPIEALDAFRSAVACSPQLMNARLNLAIAHGSLKQFDDARSEFEKIRPALESSAKFWCAWGAIERDFGDRRFDHHLTRKRIKLSDHRKHALIFVGRRMNEQRIVHVISGDPGIGEFDR